MEVLEENKRVRLGDLLVSKRLITEKQLEQALEERSQSGRRLGQALVALGMVDEKTVLDCLSEQLDVQYIELDRFPFDRDLIKKVPESLARRFRVILLREKSESFLLGMVDPTDIFCLDELSRILKKPLETSLVQESKLLEILDLAYSAQDDIAALAHDLDDELTETDVAIDLSVFGAGVSESDAPVVRLLQRIFEGAISSKASDVHIEPDEHVLRIRQRIDGVLREQVVNETRIANALMVRLKLMSNLDISEKRLPQDGRFNLKIKDRNIDIRLSTMPVQFGESVVMRILDHTEGVLPLDKVGMPAELTARFRENITRTHGLILVTGPTGSGKTTTLYGALSEINTPENKIITVEDPVEYRLPRISQVQVNEKIGLDFNTVLRAALRQDPDILLVGEIRDRESGEIALRAAMTGHLVLSTLHTNDALTSTMRLVDIGVDGHLIATALKTIVAQRLVRRVCDRCGQPHEPDVNEQQMLATLTRDISMANFKSGPGCPHCTDTGYSGRIGVFELVEVNRLMADALRRGDSEDFRKGALSNPMYTPLSRSAMEYAIDGRTSLYEVMRISAQVDDENEMDD